MALAGPLYTEYRIVLPYVSVDEVKIGLLYTVCIASLAETGGGEGVEFIINEPYEKNGEKGQFYHRILHLSSKVPAMIRMLAPKGLMEIHSKTWNNYPKIRTEYSNPDYMKEGFCIEMDTLFVDNDNGNLENVFGLDEEILRKRDVIDIDIVNDPISPMEHNSIVWLSEIEKLSFKGQCKDYKEDTDPSKVRLEKINRGPLTADWKDTETNLMTVHMFVKIEFKWWGLQNKVQTLIKKANTRFYRNFYRTLICKLDDWYGMTMDDIRALEAKTKLELEEAIRTGEPIGIAYD